MLIDSSRYKMFRTNPDEYRLRECWNLVPDQATGLLNLQSFGRRRGTAFHDLTDGNTPGEELGESAITTAEAMHAANQKFDEGRGIQVLWREQEFNIEIPGSEHHMVGRVDQMVREDESEPYILDFKTSKHRTKGEFQGFASELRQSPQVDFYLLAHPEARRMVYRVLSKKPKTSTKTEPTIEIFEIECTRAKWQLEAFAYGVHMVCETIGFWKERFGVEKPWPRAVVLPVAPENYGYREDIYQRSVFTNEGLEGYKARVEHLEVMKSLGADNGGSETDKVHSRPKEE